MIKQIFMRIFNKILLFIIVYVSRPIEWLILMIKYKNCKIYNKGRGALNKYLINKNGEVYLIKKTNFIIEYRLKVFALRYKERILSNKYKYLQEIVKKDILKDFNLCTEVSKHEIVYKYITSAEHLNVKNFNEKILLNLIKAIKNLHKQGYYHGDLSCNNILVKDGKYYLIDLDEIKVILSQKDKENDFNKLISSVKDKKIKNTLINLIKYAK